MRRHRLRLTRRPLPAPALAALLLAMGVAGSAAGQGASHAPAAAGTSGAPIVPGMAAAFEDYRTPAGRVEGGGAGWRRPAAPPGDVAPGRHPGAGAVATPGEAHGEHA